MICWGMGAGYGHATKIAHVAEALVSRGLRVVVAARDVRLMKSVARRRGLMCRVVQAPVLPRTMKLERGTLFHSDLLLSNGYSRSDYLAWAIATWRKLFSTHRPDVIAFEYAPTAILASRDLSSPRIGFGTGFYFPPSPLPRIMPDDLAGDQTQDDVYYPVVLASINEALRRLKLASIDRLEAVFDPGRVFITGAPEVDHFGHIERDVRYTGPCLENLSPGRHFDWPSGPGPRIAGYLHGGAEGVARILRHLSNTRARFVIHLGGSGKNADGSMGRQFDCGANVWITRQLFDVESMAARARCVLCHAGHGTTMASLLAGTPVFGLDMHPEQGLQIDALRRARLGDGEHLHAISENIGDRLLALTGHTSPERQRARQFADKYAQAARSVYPELIDEITGLAAPNAAPAVSQ